MNTNGAQIRIYRRVTPVSHLGSTGGAGSALNVLITGGRGVACHASLPCSGCHLKDKRWNSSAGKHEWSGVHDLITLTKTWGSNKESVWIIVSYNYSSQHPLSGWIKHFFFFKPSPLHWLYDPPRGSREALYCSCALCTEGRSVSVILM